MPRYVRRGHLAHDHLSVEKGSHPVRIRLIEPHASCLSEPHANVRETPQVPARDTCFQSRARAMPICRDFAKPSDGLEPSTPSLPCAPERLPWVATGCRSARLSRFRPLPKCDPLPPVAPAWLHKRSTLAT